jgi:hypothetical protein
MGGWHKLTDLHFRSSLGDVKQNTASRSWVAYDSIGTEVGRADDAATAMELVRNSNLTRDLRIMVNPNTIKARIKEDALVMADELKARLVSQSQSTRREILTERMDSISDAHMSMVRDDISKWARMQGYRISFNDKVVELYFPESWLHQATYGVHDFLSIVGRNRYVIGGLWFFTYLSGLLYLMYLIAGAI